MLRTLQETLNLLYTLSRHPELVIDSEWTMYKKMSVLMEEVGEVAEAIYNEPSERIIEECGDVLSVVFQIMLSQTKDPNDIMDALITSIKKLKR